MHQEWNKYLQNISIANVIYVVNVYSMDNITQRITRSLIKESVSSVDLKLRFFLLYEDKLYCLR